MNERSTAGDSGRGELRELLRRLDGRSFGAYRQLLGRHELEEFEISVDRVPPDPFAGGARVRVVVDRDKARLPPSLVANDARRTAVEDYLTRRAAENLDGLLAASRRAAPGSGGIWIDRPGPAMIERSACRITGRSIELRMFVDLPAERRRIRGRQAETLFFRTVLQLATSVLLISSRKVEQAPLVHE